MPRLVPREEPEPVEAVEASEEEVREEEPREALLAEAVGEREELGARGLHRGDHLARRGDLGGCARADPSPPPSPSLHERHSPPEAGETCPGRQGGPPPPPPPP